MKIITISTLLILFCTMTIAQEMDLAMEGSTYAKSIVGETKPKTKSPEIKYEFDGINNTSSLQEIEPANLGNNFFGEEISRKEYLFNSLYTYQVPIGPGSPATKTVIRKPAVFSATEKAYKYYKRSVKDKELTFEEAQTEYNYILDIALSIIYQDTDSFEKEVDASKNIEKKLEVFHSVKLIY